MTMNIVSLSLIWFLVGVVFLIVELALPGFILIFFTAGCWIVSITTLLFDIELTGQILIFTVSSLVLLFTMRKYCVNIFKGKTRYIPDDHYTDAKTGKTAIVTRKISLTMPGEIKVSGSFWRAIADTEIEEGQSVVIESQDPKDALTFKVKPIYMEEK